MSSAKDCAAESTAATAATVEHSIAFVTTPDVQTAKKIAYSVINQKLAACVNIIPGITSIYQWDGKINEDNEILMMLKTRSDRVPELIRHVRENHPYSVAEVISVKIDRGNEPYMDWINKTVTGGGGGASGADGGGGVVMGGDHPPA